MSTPRVGLELTTPRSNGLWSIIIIFKMLHIYFIVGGRAEGERLSNRLCTEHGAWHGARSCDPEVMSWAQTKSLMFNCLSHSGAPVIHFKLIFMQVRKGSMFMPLHVDGHSSQHHLLNKFYFFKFFFKGFIERFYFIYLFERENETEA